MIYYNLNEHVIIKFYKKKYDSIFFTSGENIHYCNTTQNTHLTSGITFLLGEMKFYSPFIISFLCISLKFLISY